MNRKKISIWVVTILTFGSGLVNLVSVMGHGIPGRLNLLLEIFPLEFIHIFRFLTILVGLSLVVSSVNIYKRKRRAFQLIFILSILSTIFHLTRGMNYEEAGVSFILLTILVISRQYFTVKSSIPNLRRSFLRLAIAILATFIYSVAGFWFIESKHFGVNFHIGAAIQETFRYLSFIGDPTLVPQTRHAKWFLDSLYFISISTILYTLYSLFRPVIYLFRTLPQERASATTIVEKYGRHAMDYFKLWQDKSYFFSATGNSFLAYRVGNNFAVVLADPVGPEEEIEATIREFNTMCDENDWGIAFHQTLPDFVPIYEKLAFRKLKIGDDAVVDLTKFTLVGKEAKEFRHSINRLENEGIHIETFQPPIPDEILKQVEEVSTEWLKIAGKRERGFTLGQFEPNYVRSTPVMAAVDQSGKLQGFVNIIPSFRKGESTIDLMRRRSDSPNGLMDYLFIKLFLYFQEQGFQTFNLGMAPMSGFQLGEEPTLEERAIHYFFQHLNFLFSFKGLKAYKAKFASYWEPRYVIYQNVFDLARHAMAINAISEIE
jgi:phosphatidylglycerol lysyltransferase